MMMSEKEMMMKQREMKAMKKKMMKPSKKNYSMEAMKMAQQKGGK